VKEIDDCKPTLEKMLQVRIASMALSLTIVVEYFGLKSLDYFIKPTTMVIVVETPEGRTMVYMVKDDTDPPTLELVRVKSSYNLKAIYTEDLSEWDVISKFGNSLVLRGEEKENNGEPSVMVLTVINDGCNIIEQEKKVPKGDPTMVTSDNSETESENPDDNKFIKSKNLVKKPFPTLYIRNYVKLDKDQNDYRLKCIFLLLKVIFLLAIMGGPWSFFI
jgi:hypothetical protein